MPTPDDYSGQPGYRNFNPPPTTPGYFTPANPTGGPPVPGRTTESSTRNGNPQATQVAAAPPPPPTPDSVTAQSYTPEEIAGAKARGMIGSNGLPIFPPGTVKFNSQGVPYNPARVGQPSSDPSNLNLPGGVNGRPFPADDQPPPEPAAKPLPNLGAWTPDQAAPWMHVRPIPPQAVPDRPPDTHVGTRPAWHPRPGEAGYGTGPRQPGNYTFGENLGLALQAGFTGPAAYTAAAIGMAESNGNPNSIHYQDGGKPWNSYGLMQINGRNDQTLRAAGINGAAAAVDPLTSYKAAFILSKGGTDFSPWSTFTHGDYKAYLDGNARPEASSTLAVGPRQEYRPPPGREAADWGRTPEHDWSPGNMPTAHDIPSIMGGLLPMALTLFAGLAGGQGALGAITFFSAYQTARNKGQLEAAKEAKTQWRDKLAETEAGLKEELLESSGLMAQYGNDFNSPAARSAWQGLAAKYQDTQLQAAIESGNSAAVQTLFKKRDEAFQTLSKTSAAATKAEEQEAEKQSNVGAERAPYSGGGEAGGGGGTDGGGATPGATPAPAAARGPEKPWENLGPGYSGAPAPPEAGPAAGVPQPSGGGRPQPAAAPPSSAESPSPEEPPPQAPAVAPGPEAPGVDGQPRPAVGGGQPTPQELPEVGIGGLAPANLPPQLSQRVTGLSPERLDQDARQYLETQKDPYRGGPSGDPLATSRNEAVRRRAAQMQSYIDRVIASTKPGDIEGALQKIDTVDPGLASVARLVDRGDQAPPSGWQLRVPFYQTINKVVTSLDPTWSAARWVTNYRTQVAFSSGTQSTQVASMNRALQHMTILYEAAKRLPQAQGGVGEWTDLNGLRNFVNTHLGSDAATNFMEARAAVARELERAFRGGSGAYAEIKADLDNVSSSGSPEQILGYIRTSAELLKGQLDAMADLYQRGTHKATTGDDLLSPEARTSLERIMKWPIDKVPEGAPPPAELDNTATPPPTNMSGPGPAPVEIPQGWVEQPQQ